MMFMEMMKIQTDHHLDRPWLIHNRVMPKLALLHQIAATRNTEIVIPKVAIVGTSSILVWSKCLPYPSSAIFVVKMVSMSNANYTMFSCLLPNDALIE